MSNDEYCELLQTKATIGAKRTRQMTLRDSAMMYVRPSSHNMHQFVAMENSCFFDICLPNYTSQDHLRRITFYKEEAQFAPDAATPFPD